MGPFAQFVRLGNNSNDDDEVVCKIRFGRFLVVKKRLNKLLEVFVRGKEGRGFGHEKRQREREKERERGREGGRREEKVIDKQVFLCSNQLALEICV